MVDAIFHIAEMGAWLAAQRRGGYEPESLTEEGFVHCSFAHQVAAVANAAFRGRTDLVLLEIDPDLVGADVRVEEVPGSGDAFPHVYGPVRVEAVVGVHEFLPGPDGSFSSP